MSAFTSGFLYALGFTTGDLLRPNGKARPVLRKRKATSISYVGLLVYMLYVSLSSKRQEYNEHIFSYCLRILVEKYDMYFLAPYITSRWLFSYCAAFFALLVFVVVFMLRIAKNASSGRKLSDLGWLGFAITAISFAGVSYATTYDIAYYAFGNTCLPLFEAPCLQIANHAHGFAFSAVGIYFVRSTAVVLSDEYGTITFFGFPVRDIEDGTYIMPTMPLPHTVYMLSVHIFGIGIFFYDLHQSPIRRGESRGIHLIE